MSILPPTAPKPDKLELKVSPTVPTAKLLDVDIRQLQMHRTTLLIPNRTKEPTNRQALLPSAIHLHRDLITGTTDSLAANFDIRLKVFDSRLKDFNRRVVARLVFRV